MNADRKRGEFKLSTLASGKFSSGRESRGSEELMPEFFDKHIEGGNCQCNSCLEALNEEIKH